MLLRCARPPRSGVRHSSTVALAFDAYKPKAPPVAGESLVILHGLYGSKQNWRSLAMAMANQTKRQTFALDLRNHGTSPHAAGADYVTMAADVARFIEQRKLEKVVVVGHSMGGKVAMALALRPDTPVEKLVVLDMSPAVGQISPDFAKYLEAMKAIVAARVRSRKEADQILAKYEPEIGIRQFLLTNLDRALPNDPYGFRLPLDILTDALGEIGAFPYTPEERTFDGPALFIKGAKSKYINRNNIPLIDEFFPNAQHATLMAGHWVHAEKPKEFIKLLVDFCGPYAKC